MVRSLLFQILKKIFKVLFSHVCFTVFIDMPEMVGYMRQNYESWKEYNVSAICFHLIYN